MSHYFKPDGTQVYDLPTDANGIPKVTIAGATVDVDVDVSALATSAKQDTGNTSLSSIDTKLSSQATAANQSTANTSLSSIATNTGRIPAQGTAAMAASTPITIATNDTQLAALILALSVPTTFTSVTPSDSTDTSSYATKGLLVSVAGAVYARGTGDSNIILLGTFPIGAFVPGKFQRVGASTTATVVACGG